MMSKSSNPLIGLGGAIVGRLDAAAVEDHAAADGGEIGLGAERATGNRGQFGPDADGPAGAVEFAARWRDPDMTRMRGCRKNLIQLVANQSLDVRLRIQLPWRSFVGPHEFRNRGMAVGRTGRQ